jgi:N-acetylglucosamine transport system permease protein
MASLSTTAEITTGRLFKFESGFNWGNYVNAWKSQKVSVFFMNSLIYTAISCSSIIFIAAPAAYVLSRIRFRGNMFLQNMFASALGVGNMIVMRVLSYNKHESD